MNVGQGTVALSTKVSWYNEKEFPALGWIFFYYSYYVGGVLVGLWAQMAT